MEWLPEPDFKNGLLKSLFDLYATFFLNPDYPNYNLYSDLEFILIKSKSLYLNHFNRRLQKNITIVKAFKSSFGFLTIVAPPLIQ